MSGDDEACIRNSVSRALQAQDFDVDTTVDGIDGLAKIERWRPDVVLASTHQHVDYLDDS